MLEIAHVGDRAQAAAHAFCLRRVAGWSMRKARRVRSGFVVGSALRAWLLVSYSYTAAAPLTARGSLRLHDRLHVLGLCEGCMPLSYGPRRR
ncbi:uncharacterized protein LAESUDRAFT_315351 [Laetiporus sulphureus 93-53]|uniref:Uncharacterized protein n=1 Tax=Laetiporus sulphureus 93-53 TaxID=1314785 RepID=A0A165AP77_9APHY|nr:uncharacterized protein LAESUDRAFT_315351 [Laetiporus sulphureus 93-53]KZS99389.1 hypothetical protein LAESUDRAFT_315351 [Laetiporus sulphureus 93-53]